MSRCVVGIDGECCGRLPGTGWGRAALSAGCREGLGHVEAAASVQPSRSRRWWRSRTTSPVGGTGRAVQARPRRVSVGRQAAGVLPHPARLATDTRSVALIGTRMTGMRPVVKDEQLAMLRIFVDRRRSVDENHPDGLPRWIHGCGPLHVFGTPCGGPVHSKVQIAQVCAVGSPIRRWRVGG